VSSARNQSFERVLLSMMLTVELNGSSAVDVAVMAWANTNQRMLRLSSIVVLRDRKLRPRSSVQESQLALWAIAGRSCATRGRATPSSRVVCAGWESTLFVASWTDRSQLRRQAHATELADCWCCRMHIHTRQHTHGR